MADPIMRFGTLCGAVVAVTRETGDHRYRWDCQGCGARDRYVAQINARTDANEHAGWCRALPPTDL